MSDLAELVERLRKARPDLSVRLPDHDDTRPEYDHLGGRWSTPESAHDELYEETARSIVIGVCAEALAEKGYGMAHYLGCPWKATAICVPGKINAMPPSPDFLTALVSAVIALSEGAPRAQ